jgi:hypothetical protein
MVVALLSLGALLDGRAKAVRGEALRLSVSALFVLSVVVTPFWDGDG